MLVRWEASPLRRKRLWACTPRYPNAMEIWDNFNPFHLLSSRVLQTLSTHKAHVNPRPGVGLQPYRKNNCLYFCSEIFSNSLRRKFINLIRCYLRTIFDIMTFSEAQMAKVILGRNSCIWSAQFEGKFRKSIHKLSNAIERRWRRTG